MRLPFVLLLASTPAWPQARMAAAEPLPTWAGPVVFGLGLALLMVAAWGVRTARRARSLHKALVQAQARQRQHEAQALRRHQAQEIAAHMQQADSPQGLGERLLAGLAPILDLGAGLVARWDAEPQQLQPLARWAGAGADLQAASASSLGLMADCARRGEPLVLGPQEAGGLRIQSGLGGMAARTLVLQPVRQGGRVHAVLELASTREWTADDHQLLADLEPLIALSLALQARAQRGVVGGEDQKDQWLLDAPSALTVQDAAGALHYANRAFVQLIGLEPQQPLPGHLRSTWAEVEQLNEFLHRAATQTELQGFAAQLLRQDGRRLQVLIDARWSQHEGRRSLVAVYRCV